MAANGQSFEIILYTAAHSREELLIAVSEVLSSPTTKWRVMMAGNGDVKVPTLVTADSVTQEDLTTAIKALKKP